MGRAAGLTDPCFVDLAMRQGPGFSVLPGGRKAQLLDPGQGSVCTLPIFAALCIFQKRWPQVQCVQSWTILTFHHPSLLSLRAVSFSTQ